MGLVDISLSHSSGVAGDKGEAALHRGLGGCRVLKGGPIGNRISRQGLKDPGFRGEQGPSESDD